MSFYYSFDWFRVINNTYVVYYYTANSIRGSEKKITHDDGRPALVSDVGYKKSMREKWLESVECLQVEQTLPLHCLLWILTIKWRNRSLNFSIRVSFYIYSILVYIWGELFFAVPSMNFRRSSIYLVASLNWLLLSEFPWYTLHSLHTLNWGGDRPPPGDRCWGLVPPWQKKIVPPLRVKKDWL